MIGTSVKNLLSLILLFFIFGCEPPGTAGYQQKTDAIGEEAYDNFKSLGEQMAEDFPEIPTRREQKTARRSRNEDGTAKKITFTDYSAFLDADTASATVQSYVDPPGYGSNGKVCPVPGGGGNVMSIVADGQQGGCGYSFPMDRSDVKDFCVATNQACTGQDVQCHTSNCTTSSYLAIIDIMKTREDWPEQQKNFMCRPPTGFGKAYMEYIKPYGLVKMMSKYELGPYESISSRQFNEFAAKGWPSKGNPVQLNRSSSGHAVIFDNYEFDGRGKISKVCYYSSNKGTRGFGRQCEKISRINSMQIGKLVEDEQS